MAIPDYQSLMLPVLQIASDGRDYQTKDIISRLIDSYGMTDEEKTRLLPSGTSHVFGSRVAWAKTYLKQAGLLSSPRRGVFHITDDGLELLSKNPTFIDNTVLANYPAFIAFRDRSRQSSSDSSAQVVMNELPLTQTPEDAMASAYKRLSRLLKYSPTCGLPPLALALFFRQVSVS